MGPKEPHTVKTGYLLVPDLIHLFIPLRNPRIASNGVGAVMLQNLDARVPFVIATEACHLLMHCSISALARSGLHVIVYFSTDHANSHRCDAKCYSTSLRLCIHTLDYSTLVCI